MLCNMGVINNRLRRGFYFSLACAICFQITSYATRFAYLNHPKRFVIILTFHSHINSLNAEVAII